MAEQIPKIIKEVGFDFNWDEEKVWKIDVPTEEMNISELEWHFDIPFWQVDSGSYNLKPWDVINDPVDYKTEYDRTMKADTIHPIDIMFWKNRWLILDGLHRLVKQKIQGKKTVLVRKVDKKFIPDIVI